MNLFLICTLVSIAGTILYLLQVGAACSLVKRNSAPECRATTAPAGSPHSVSVLKPLRGLDDNLFDNLASFCTQDYPSYEIIIGLQDFNDPAYKVAKKIQDKYPDRDISIVVEKCSAGLNPKVNNLIPAYRKSRHPYVLISDSNVHG